MKLSTYTIMSGSLLQHYDLARLTRNNIHLRITANGDTLLIEQVPAAPEQQTTRLPSEAQLAREARAASPAPQKEAIPAVVHAPVAAQVPTQMTPPRRTRKTKQAAGPVTEAVAQQQEATPVVPTRAAGGQS